MNANDFTYDNWHLYEAIQALMAYDLGATDSGVKDDRLKEAIKKFFASLSDHDFRVIVSKYARDYLTDEMLASGYGLEDILEFVKWLNDELHCDIG